MDHVWKQHARVPYYLVLENVQHAMVRTTPMPDGRYLWQFRKVVSYADSVATAKDYVEAGAEYFEVMRRNPYAG